MLLFFIQWKNELLKLFARKRTYLGFGGAIVAELVFLLLWRHPLAQRAFEKSFLRDSEALREVMAEYFRGLTMALMSVTFTFLLLGGLYLALVAGDIMAKEVEDGTLRMILARPVGRLRVWLVKWLSVSVYTFGLVGFIGLSSLVLAPLLCDGLGKLAVIYGQHPRQLNLIATYDTVAGIWQYLKALFVLGIAMHTVSAMGYMFSCLNMKPATAAIVTVGVFFLDAVVKMVPFFQVFDPWLLSYHLACWLRMFDPVRPPGEIAGSLVYLASLALVFLSIGAWRFNRRDFKP